VSKLFANPYARLAGRAIIAGLLAAAASYQTYGGGTVAWHAVAAAGIMAALEFFTPLNSLVGSFKPKG
jgi:hypothetical protein